MPSWWLRARCVRSRSESPRKNPDQSGQGSFNGPGQTRTEADSGSETAISAESSAECGAEAHRLNIEMQSILTRARRLNGSDRAAIVKALVDALSALVD